MLKRHYLLGAIAPVVLSLVGCVAEMGAPGEEPVETTQEELWKASWTGRAEEVAGIARTSGGRPYAWYKSGWACYGNEGFPGAENLCASREFRYYTPPGYEYKDIVGMTIKKSNSRVITWYVDGSYTSGTSEYLDRYSTNTAFYTPARPGGGYFSTYHLLDVEHNGADDKYYYYWSTYAECVVLKVLDPARQCSTTIYRTIGTASDADAYGSATPVTQPNPHNAHGPIVGTAIHNMFAGVWLSYYLTYYNDGFVNISTSSGNIAQN